ncbi:hypothetical protein WMY93_033598 [Mugilogobius chulae]|uniref:Amine oxidase n=1 Tax=Mugilogobius chulae TaxID=88201 RepID=A0AAW0MHQ3_9GOBI
MRVFDVRFRNERILYELSVQEAMSVYGSVTPGMGMTKFLDSGSGIGRFAHELVCGEDCPYDATYRTITTIANYDYMWDFSSFLVQDSLKHGHQVAPNVLRNIHTHFINFTGDLDFVEVCDPECLCKCLVKLLVSEAERAEQQCD